MDIEQLNNEFEKRLEVILNNIIVSDFPIDDINEDDKHHLSVYNAICCIYNDLNSNDSFNINYNGECLNKINNINEFKLIKYIGNSIKPDSNIIVIDKFNIELLKSFSSSNILEKTIKSIIDKNIIKYTEYRNIYVVNHNYIFKGNIETFKKVYHYIKDNIEIENETETELTNI